MARQLVGWSGKTVNQASRQLSSSTGLLIEVRLAVFFTLRLPGSLDKLAKLLGRLTRQAGKLVGWWAAVIIHKLVNTVTVNIQQPIL